MARSRLFAVCCLAVFASVGCVRPDGGGSRSAAFSPGSLFGGPPAQKEPGIVEREPDDERVADIGDEGGDDEEAPLARRPTKTASRARREPTAAEEAVLTGGAGTGARSPRTKTERAESSRSAGAEDEASRRRESDELFDEVFAELGVERPARSGSESAATRPTKTTSAKPNSSRLAMDDEDDDVPPRKTTRPR